MEIPTREDVKQLIKPNGIRVDVNREEFALQLKTWRLRSRLTQVQVARRWGVSRYTIMRAENGTPIDWTTSYKLFVSLLAEQNINAIPS